MIQRLSRKLMDNYSIESLPEPDPKERRFTRILLLVWLVLGLIVGGVACYVVVAAFRPPAKVPVYVGELDEYAPNSINKEFINADFFDDTANKDQETLPLQIVRDANGNFVVLYARSTNQDQAILIPRQCLVEWDDSLQLFIELCAGSRWTREGKYVGGPAPRDLDRFPARINENKLYIDLELQKGAAHP